MHKTRLEWKQVLRCWDAAFRVAALYAFFGMFWILFSDRIVENVVQDRMQMVLVQTYKGWFFVLVTGVMIALTVYRYTSKLLAAEQSILQTRSRFRSRLNSAHSLLKTVIDSAPDLVFVKSRSGVYMHCNASFIAFVGRTEEEILGKTDFELFPGKTASFFRKKDELVFSSRSEQRNEEWLTYPDGTRLLHDTLKAPYFSKSGELLGLIGVSRGITEQRKVAVELQRAKEAAEASSEAKSLFLANMSHEIRTPLNGVIGALQLLEEGGVSGEQRDLLDMANNAALSLKHLIQDLLDLSQIEAGKMHIVKEPLDLENLLHSCVAMFAEQAREAGSSLLVNVDPNLPERLEGDRGRLLQLVGNLVGNAIKFCRQGRIEVSAHVLRLSRKDCFAQVLLVVADTGIGIPEEKLSGIFENFAQVDSSHSRKYQGLGLGLAIVRELSAAMDGEVALESEEGEGTAVFVSLRMTIVAETRGREAEFFLETSFPRSRPLRLVVAEDNPVNSALLQKVLHSRGHSCTVVTNGRELMELRDRDGFDAVFMDIQMPEMDGLEAAALIRKGGTSLLPPDIPIVAVTAHAMPEERSRIFQAGMNYFLEKPVSLDALDRVLGKLSGTDISSRDSTVQSE